MVYYVLLQPLLKLKNVGYIKCGSEECNLCFHVATKHQSELEWQLEMSLTS